MGFSLKIVLITEYSAMGGGESNLLKLAAEFSQKHDLIVISPSGELADQAKSSNIPHIPYSLFPAKRWLRGLPLAFPATDSKICQALEDADVIHAYSINIITALRAYKEKIFLTIHGPWERPTGLRAKMLCHFVSQGCFVSKDVKKQASEELQKWPVVYLGTNINSKISRPELTGKWNIVSVGRFQKIKGQDLLIAALNSLASKEFEIHCKLVGGVNEKNTENLQYYKSILKLIDNIKNPYLNIEIINFQKNLTPIWHWAHFCVVPSRYESFSMVSVEALSYGLPVVAPKVGGVQEIIDEEAYGQLFTPMSSKSMEKAINKIKDRFHQLSSHSAIERSQLFSVKRQSAELFKIYSTLNK